MWPSERRGVPHVPPSLNINSWEKRGDPDSPSGRSHKGITPYLGLRARYSQIWFNRWTVLLLLVLVHFLLTADSLRNGLDDSKDKALSACKKVEDTGSAMASMPHYLSRGVNSLAASGITNSVQALITVLEMIITGVEQLILFFIHMMTDTYVCLIALAVHGALNATAAVVEKTTDAMNKAIDGFADGLMKGTDAIQATIDTAWSIADGVTDKVEDAGDTIVDTGKGIGDTIGGLFGRDLIPMVEPPPATPDLPVLLARGLPSKPDVKKPLEEFFQKIKDVDIDSSGFVADINKLNDDLPTFDEIRNKTDETVGIPFGMVRDELKKAYGNWTFDHGIFPVAQREKLSFCSEGSAISDFFDTLYAVARKAKIFASVVLALLAALACVPMAYMEKLRWDRQARQAEVFSQNRYDHLDVGYMYSRPRTARVGLGVAAHVRGWRLSRKKQILARWCVAYATSLPALFVLSLALAGLFSCLCQVVLLKAIEREVPALSAQVGDFADDVVYSLGNASRRWADDANGVIGGVGDDINEDVLGHVSRATSAVNDTINTFTDAMDKGLRAALGDTAFRDAAAGVIRCVVGLKIETVQRGLTWIHDHAHVELPRFPDDIYSVGAHESIAGDGETRSFLAAPGAATADEVTDAVLHVTRWLRGSIVQEALISLALFLVYVLVVLTGVVWALVRALAPDDGAGAGETPPTSMAEPPRSPRSPRRSKSLGQIGSPRLPRQHHHQPTGGDDDPFSDNCNMEGVASGHGTFVRQLGRHTRTSSHGSVGHVRG